MNNEILATKIVDALLTTAAGHGTRLAVKRAGDGREFDLGGWGRTPAIRKVADVMGQCGDCKFYSSISVENEVGYCDKDEHADCLFQIEGVIDGTSGFLKVRSDFGCIQFEQRTADTSSTNL